MIHLHVRDADGRHLPRRRGLSRGDRRISQAVGDRLVVQITSESLGLYSPAEQMAVVLETNPEAVSLALRDFAPDGADERDFGDFLDSSKQMRIWPQFILYSPQEAARLGGDAEAGADPLRPDRGPLRPRAVCAHSHVAPRDLLPFLARTCRASNRGASAPSAAARPPASPPRRCSGGHARVGFENNLACPMARWPPPTPSSSARSRARSNRSGCHPDRRRFARGDRGGDGWVNRPPYAKSSHTASPRKANKNQARANPRQIKMLDSFGFIRPKLGFSMGYGESK